MKHLIPLTYNQLQIVQASLQLSLKYADSEYIENVDEITAVSIEDEIRSSLKNYEPRVELIDVNVDPNFDENQFDVTISYRIVGIDIPPSQLEFALLPSR